jgi:hypothetical protein
VQAARIRKTEAFRDNRAGFVDQLAADIADGVRKASKLGKQLAVRLNGTSDIAWENQHGSGGKTLMERFPTVQFYDYTKLPGRKVPLNYHLTVSYSAANAKYADKVIASDKNAAVVFRTPTLPATFRGRQVINGDTTDLRFLDVSGVVVGLYAKGKAKNDRTGFVVEN